jgi:hypothetical protein
MAADQWNGDQIAAAIGRASRFAIDEVMSACVLYAKQNHPGWKNRTGTAEGSIRVVDFAHEDERGTVGVWGSVDVDYMIWLELNHGSALRNAADSLYPRLHERIRAAYDNEVRSMGAAR